MMTTASLYISVILVIVFAAIMVIAALSDFRYFLISNRLCLTLAILAPLFITSYIAGPQPILLLGSIKFHLLATFAITCTILVVCSIFFGFGIMGGGDVKLITAASLWTGPVWTLEFLTVTALAGGIVTLAVMFLPENHEQPIGEISHIVKNQDPIIPGIRVPYGIGIAFGGLFAAFQMGLQILMNFQG